MSTIYAYVLFPSQFPSNILLSSSLNHLTWVSNMSFHKIWIDFVRLKYSYLALN